MCWGLVGGLIGGVLAGAVHLLLGGPGALASIATGTLWAGTAFCLLGSGFSLMLALAARDHRVESLPTYRATFLGGLVGAALPFAGLAFLASPFRPDWIALAATSVWDFLLPAAMVSGISALAAGSLAAATLAIARSVPADPELDAGIDHERVTAPPAELP